MPYELRLTNHQFRFETEEEAITAATMALRDNPDAEPEIIDLTTGQPAAPASSKSWRDELRSRVGF